MQSDPVLSSRRAFLGRSASGVGLLALSSLLNPSILRASSTATSSQPQHWTGVVNPPHRSPRIRRVIWLCMAGGPPQHELFDYNPKPTEMHGQPMPESFTKGQP